MLEKASLTQGTSLVTGERIDYNINTAQVKAAGAINTQTGKTNSGRVNMVLEPAKEEPNSDKPIAPETETAITVQPATEKDIHADAISD